MRLKLDKDFWADRCLTYILESEEEDFEENPTNTHVYYAAMAAVFGLDIAEEVLEQALIKQGGL